MHHGICHMVGYALPWYIRHWDLPPLTLNLMTYPLDIRTLDLPLLVTSGGDPWRPVQTCSFGDRPSPRHLLVFIRILQIAFWVLYIFKALFLSTLQYLRFGLKSAETGLLIAMNDIINLTLALFIGYFGKKVNKPRYEYHS